MATNLPGPSHVTPPTGATGGGVAFSESDIQQIVSNGFSREEAIVELRSTGGNVQLALASLLAKAISFNYHP